MAAPTAPVELIRKELPFPSQVDNVVLAGAAKTVTVPAEVSWMLISVTALCYMRTGGAAIVPAADKTDGTGSFPVQATQDPLFLSVRGIETFSIIGTANVGLAWFREHTDGVL